ncbi:hypothetical protein AAK899_06050 [Erysipelotrichaceae bacterium 51-3]|uniref:hypothetical protein n=1 Tax=Allobaculum sp. JKK-2023 TaxID=3108943 RepID=UPI002B059923|nr:hypothetical protein [Allobaculum sp. JKK-2023]
MSRNLVERKPSNSRVIAPDPDQPVGKNLYIDKKRRIIYLSPYLHEALYLPKFDYKKFNRYKSRYLIVAATFMILATAFDTWFHWPIWSAIIITVALWGGLEYSFYKFQKTLVPVKGFDAAKCTPTVDSVIAPDQRSKCYLKVVLYILLGVLLVFNAYDQHYSTIIIVACWAALLFCFYTAFKLTWMLIKSPKN